MSTPKLPFRMLHRNILVGTGDQHAAVFRIDTVSYPYLSESDKIGWLGRLARFAYGTNVPHFSLYRVCRAYPASNYTRQAASLLDARHQDPEAWRAFLSGHQEHLTRLAAHEPEVYLIVSLQGQQLPSIGRTFERLDAKLKRAVPPITAKQLTGLEATEERLLRLTTGMLPARRASTMEIQWLLRRAACRGLREPKIDANWQPTALKVVAEHTDGDEDGRVTYAPRRSDLVRHVNAPIEEDARALRVRSEEGDSYQAMLALGALPDTCQFPGAAELLYTPLDAVQFPVDVVMHVRRIVNREAAGKVRNKVIDADNVYEDATTGTHGPLSYLPAENRALARDLDAYLQSPDHPPLLDVAISLAVGAPNPQELDDRVDLLEQQYGTVSLHRPAGLQPALFDDHLPRPDCGRVRDYAAVMTIEQFGSLMPIGVHSTGSQRGVYLAHTVGGSHRPIKVDITEASRTARPPSWLLAGSQGSGKTFTAQLLAIHAERRGSLVVDIDPKPDHHLEDLPELSGRVHVIELSGDDRYRGEFDPLVVAPESLREDLAHTYAMSLMPQAPQTWETQIRRAVKAVLTHRDPCMVRVLDWLEHADSADARAAGESLAVWADSGIGRLGFADRHHEGPRLTAQHPVTTIKAPGLTLPGPEVSRADYHASERLAVATLQLVTGYAMRLISGDRSTHKLVLFDEAWFMLGSRDGRRWIDRINRTGRAENATLVLATQQLSDAGDIETLVGTRLMFGQETDAEARHALELEGLDPNDAGLVARVRGFRKGRCLMRDIDDRVAEIQIDPVYPHLLEILNTSPRAQVQVA